MIALSIAVITLSAFCIYLTCEVDRLSSNVRYLLAITRDLDTDLHGHTSNAGIHKKAV